MKRGPTGVSTGSVFKPTTKKQKADANARWKKLRKQKEATYALLGKLIYVCSSCDNRVRMNEDLGDRKVMCSKCNNGFYTRN